MEEVNDAEVIWGGDQGDRVCRRSRLQHLVEDTRSPLGAILHITEQRKVDEGPK